MKTKILILTFILPLFLWNCGNAELEELEEVCEEGKEDPAANIFSGMKMSISTALEFTLELRYYCDGYVKDSENTIYAPDDSHFKINNQPVSISTDDYAPPEYTLTGQLNSRDEILKFEHRFAGTTYTMEIVAPYLEASNVPTNLEVGSTIEVTSNYQTPEGWTARNRVWLYRGEITPTADYIDQDNAKVLDDGTSSVTFETTDYTTYRGKRIFVTGGREIEGVFSGMPYIPRSGIHNMIIRKSGETSISTVDD